MATDAAANRIFGVLLLVVAVFAERHWLHLGEASVGRSRRVRGKDWLNELRISGRGGLVGKSDRTGRLHPLLTGYNLAVRRSSLGHRATQFCVRLIPRFSTPNA